MFVRRSHVLHQRCNGYLFRQTSILLQAPIVAGRVHFILSTTASSSALSSSSSLSFLENQLGLCFSSFSNNVALNSPQRRQSLEVESIKSNSLMANVLQCELERILSERREMEQEGEEGTSVEDQSNKKENVSKNEKSVAVDTVHSLHLQIQKADYTTVKALLDLIATREKTSGKQNPSIVDNDVVDDSFVFRSSMTLVAINGVPILIPRQIEFFISDFLHECSRRRNSHNKSQRHGNDELVSSAPPLSFPLSFSFVLLKRYVGKVGDVTKEGKERGHSSSTSLLEDIQRTFSSLDFLDEGEENKEGDKFSTGVEKDESLSSKKTGKEEENQAIADAVRQRIISSNDQKVSSSSSAGNLRSGSSDAELSELLDNFEMTKEK